MNHTRQLAEQNRLSRRVLMMAHSKEDNLYKVHVEINDRDRGELSYYFIDGTAHISQVCDCALDMATSAFLGIPSPVIKIIEKQVEEAITPPDNKEVPSEEKSSEQKSSKESSPSKKSRSKKEQVDSTPVQEEMELVESPYKDTKTEAAPKESVEKKKAEKTSTAEPYNREDKASKASFAVFVTRLYNGSKKWKEREDVKEISTKLHGMPFMEKDGSIHPDFEEKCKELLGLDDGAAL